MSASSSPWISASAEVAEGASVGPRTRIWALAQVRESASIGERCVIGRGVYVDVGVSIGDRCKIENGAQIFGPSRVDSGVFVGPGAILTNDRTPRAINPDGTIKKAGDWKAQGVSVARGASIGAGAVIIGGVEVGAWAMIGAGSIVTRDVPSHALVVGSPGRRVGWVGVTGESLLPNGEEWRDPATGQMYREVDGGLERL